MKNDTSADEILRRLLRDARVAAGIRQADLAASLGEPQSFVSKYEHGERRLSFLDVRRICEALHLDFVGFVARLEEELQ